MHRNTVCGTIAYDESTGRILNYHDNQTGESPFLGNANADKIKKWWEMRAIPASRSALRDVLKKAGCETPGIYLAKNLALSMTDTYWIRPIDINVSYEDVKLLRFADCHNGKIPYHNATSYDPNASLGGQMDKYWDISEGIPILVKESYKYYGQQSVNEVFATRVHEAQKTNVPFVRYYAYTSEDHAIVCKCESFTSENAEFISAYEVLESQKGKNDISNYDNYIKICTEIGIPNDEIQKFMDYQTLTDFIISNTDEHLCNFGILRNSNTMKIIGPAPIFDSGNSMFYSDEKRIAYTRSEILNREITSFYKKEEQLLKKIHDKNIIKLDLLPTPKDAKDLYQNAGLPEWKTDFISKNYETKLQLVKEFQHGKTISFYNEKQQEKKNLVTAYKAKQQETSKGQRFIMLCGIPGSGKTKKAYDIQKQIEISGYKTVQASGFFAIDKNSMPSFYFINTREILKKAEKKAGYENTVSVISLNDIRNEIKNKCLYNEEIAFAIAETRIKTALLSGATVIYDAANINRATREHFTAIADEIGITEKELYVMEKEKEKIEAKDNEWMEMIKITFANNLPDISEGWTSIHRNDRKIERKNELESPDFSDR